MVSRACEEGTRNGRSCLPLKSMLKSRSEKQKEVGILKGVGSTVKEVQITRRDRLWAERDVRRDRTGSGHRRQMG